MGDINMEIGNVTDSASLKRLERQKKRLERRYDRLFDDERNLKIVKAQIYAEAIGLSAALGYMGETALVSMLSGKLTSGSAAGAGIFGFIGLASALVHADTDARIIIESYDFGHGRYEKRDKLREKIWDINKKIDMLS